MKIAGILSKINALLRYEHLSIIKQNPTCPY